MKNETCYKTQKLVLMAKEGDEAALNKLFAVYGERIRRILRLRMGGELRSKVESMDLVQDVFISALKDLGNFTYQNEGDFLRWMSRIAENRIRDNIDQLHANKRDIRKEIPLSSNRPNMQDSFVATNEPVNATTPSVIIAKIEHWDKLEKAIDRLKPEYREVIILTKIDELSYKEAGARLGKTPDAIRMLLSRAIAELSRDFEKNE